MLKTFVKHFDNLLGKIGVGLFITMLVLISMQILFRHVLRIGVPWTEELSRMAFIYLAYFGAAVSVRSGEMIVIDTLLKRIKGRMRHVWDTGIIMFAIFFTGMMSASSLQMMQIAWGSRFATIRWISAGWLYFPLVFSFSVMFIHYVCKLIVHMKGEQTK